MQVSYVVIPYYVRGEDTFRGMQREFTTLDKATVYAKTLICDEYVIEIRNLVDRKITRSPPILDFKTLFG